MIEFPAIPAYLFGAGCLLTEASTFRVYVLPLVSNRANARAVRLAKAKRKQG